MGQADLPCLCQVLRCGSTLRAAVQSALDSRPRHPARFTRLNGTLGELPIVCRESIQQPNAANKKVEIL